MNNAPFLYDRVEFRKNEAIEKRDRWPRLCHQWSFWDGKVSAYRSILHLMRKGPRPPAKISNANTGGLTK